MFAEMFDGLRSYYAGYESRRAAAGFHAAATLSFIACIAIGSGLTLADYALHGNTSRSVTFFEHKVLLLALGALIGYARVCCTSQTNWPLPQYRPDWAQRLEAVCVRIRLYRGDTACCGHRRGAVGMTDADSNRRPEQYLPGAPTPTKFEIATASGLATGGNAALLQGGRHVVRAIASSGLASGVGTLAPGTAVGTIGAAIGGTALATAAAGVTAAVATGTFFGWTAGDAAANAVCASMCQQ